MRLASAMLFVGGALVGDGVAQTAVQAQTRVPTQAPALRRFEIPVPDAGCFSGFSPMGRERVMAIACAGDLDRDGLADIAVGLPGDGLPRSGLTGSMDAKGADLGDATLNDPEEGVATHTSENPPPWGRVLYLSSRDGRVLDVPQFAAPQRWEAGAALAPAGDCDGDGTPDMLVASPDVMGFTPGCVELQSGASGAILRRWWGKINMDRFGSSVARIADINGDGVPDIAIGAPERQGAGYAVVVSGSDGSTLREFNGDTRNDNFGMSVGQAGDVDADGVPDLFVGAIQYYVKPEPSNGYVVIYSGRDGHLVHSIEGLTAGSAFGDSVCTLGDVDGDGHDDFVVAAPRDSSEGKRVAVGGGDVWLGSDKRVHVTDSCGAGAVFLYSGADAKLIARISGQNPGDDFGCSLLATDDLDGDHVRDLLVGAPGRGEVWLLSGRDLRVLTVIAGGHDFGRAMAALGDIDGDGRADYAVASAGAGGKPPSVSILSGRDLLPHAETHADH